MSEVTYESIRQNILDAMTDDVKPPGRADGGQSVVTFASALLILEKAATYRKVSDLAEAILAHGVNKIVEKALDAVNERGA